MNHLTFASLGFLVIGLLTTGIITWFTLRRIADSSERQCSFRWLTMFGLSLCTLMGATPLLGQNQFWILMLPLAGTWLSLDSLHRIGEKALVTNSTRVPCDSKTA